MYFNILDFFCSLIDGSSVTESSHLSTISSIELCVCNTRSSSPKDKESS